jgi:hypothetical protein
LEDLRMPQPDREPQESTRTVPPTYLYAGRALDFWSEIARDETYQAMLGVSPVNQIVDEIATAFPRGITPLLLGADEGTIENRLLTGLSSKRLLKKLIVHELTSQRAEKQKRKLEARFDQQVARVVGLFTKFPFGRSHPQTPLLVALLGSTLANVDLEPFVAWVAREMVTGDLFCCDFPAIKPNDDPRRARPHFSPTEHRWFRQALEEYARDEHLRGPIELVSGKRRGDGRVVFWFAGRFPKHGVLAEVIQTIRYEPALVLHVCRRAGLALVGRWRRKMTFDFHSLLFRKE